MKRTFLHPVPILCLLIAVAGAVIANVPMVALGLLATVATLGLLSAREVQNQQSAGGLESLSPEGRIFLKPVRNLVEDIDKILAESKDSPTVQIIGPEAAAESKRLMNEVGRSLIARDELKKSLRGRYEAEKELGEARMRLEFAGVDEKRSLNAAIEARTAELQHYTDIDGNIKRIELGVKQAEAVLSEMRAKLAMSASADRATLDPDTDLRETIGRLKNLSASYDEADQVVRGSIQT